MDLELIFTIANNSPMPAWLLLVFAPNWRWTQRIVHSILMPVLLGLAYALLLFTDFGGGGDGNFFSLAGVMALFDKPQTVIAAWIHYLVFDLFVGAWQVREVFGQVVEAAHRRHEGVLQDVRGLHVAAQAAPHAHADDEPRLLRPPRADARYSGDDEAPR